METTQELLSMIKADMASIPFVLWKYVLGEGGATYNVHTSEFNPTTGYMVALEGCELAAPMPSTFSIFANLLEAYLKGFSNHLDCKNTTNYLGLWYNEVDNKLYFDISERVDNWENAARLGEERKQLAIYNNETKEVEYL